MDDMLRAQALKLHHSRCIDTSSLFMHPRGPPYRPSLRRLASDHLNKTIQHKGEEKREEAGPTDHSAEPSKKASADMVGATETKAFVSLTVEHMDHCLVFLSFFLSFFQKPIQPRVSELKRQAPKSPQVAVRLGHDSVEDAQSALELFLLKLIHGPAFGEVTKTEGDPLPETLWFHQNIQRKTVLIDKSKTLKRFATGSWSRLDSFFSVVCF